MLRGYIFTNNERKMLLSWLKGTKPKDIRTLKYRIRRAEPTIIRDYRLLVKVLTKIQGKKGKQVKKNKDSKSKRL